MIADDVKRRFLYRAVAFSLKVESIGYQTKTINVACKASKGRLAANRKQLVKVFALLSVSNCAQISLQAKLESRMHEVSNFFQWLHILRHPSFLLVKVLKALECLEDLA